MVCLPSSTGQTASRAGTGTGTETGSRLKGMMGFVIRTVATCVLQGQAKELSCPVLPPATQQRRRERPFIVPNCVDSVR